MRGTGRHGGLDAAEGGVSAVHGALLAQRALQGAADPPRMGVGGPEGRVRHGVPGIRVGQGRDRRRGDGGQEADGRRQPPAGGDRRDHDLPAARVPGRAPQAHPHERHDRRLNREIGRRTRVVESFPDGNGALMLVRARIRYAAANEWSNRRYLDMSRLDDNLPEANRSSRHGRA